MDPAPAPPRARPVAAPSWARLIPARLTRRSPGHWAAQALPRARAAGQPLAPAPQAAAPGVRSGLAGRRGLGRRGGLEIFLRRAGRAGRRGRRGCSSAADPVRPASAGGGGGAAGEASGAGPCGSPGGAVLRPAWPVGRLGSRPAGARDAVTASLGAPPDPRAASSGAVGVASGASTRGAGSVAGCRCCGGAGSLPELQALPIRRRSLPGLALRAPPARCRPAGHRQLSARRRRSGRIRLIGEPVATSLDTRPAKAHGQRQDEKNDQEMATADHGSEHLVHLSRAP